MKATILALAIAGTFLLAACGTTAMQDPTRLWGSPATAQEAARTIVIGPQTKHVNLIGGEIIRFAVGNDSFTWSFDGAQFPAKIDISRISNGLLQRPVFAYVEGNPMYMGGDTMD